MAESLEGRALLTVSSVSALQRRSAIVAKAATSPTISSPVSARIVGNQVVLSVLGRDASGEKTLSYTWSVASMPAGAPSPIFSDNGTNGAKRINAVLGSSGVYKFNVTITNREGRSVVGSVRLAVASRAVRLAIEPSAMPMTIGETRALTASVIDQFGRTIGRAGSVVWKASAGPITKAGRYTAPSAPTTVVISARSGSLSGTALIAVAPRNTAPTLRSVSFQGLGGTSATLVASAQDDGGGSNLTYTWATITQPDGSPGPRFAANGQAETRVDFSQAGAYRFALTVTDSGGLTASGTVDLVVSPTATSVIVTPNAAQLGPGQTLRFDALAMDQFGRPMPAGPAFAWSSANGQIDGNGNYTSSEFGGVDIVTAAIPGASGSANVFTTNAAPSIVSIARDGGGPIQGTTASLHAVATDDGGSANLVYAWSCDSSPAGAPPPTFSGDGPDVSATFGQAGSYVVRLTVRDRGGLSATSVISVDVMQAAAAIALTPSAISLGSGQSRAFSATIRDQFGQPMTAAAGVAWSASSGSIDADGRYTAPGGPATATVAAEIDGVRAVATVLTDNARPTISGFSGADQPIVGTSATLTALASDDGGPENLTYAWSITGSPAGSTLPTFARNGTADARSTTLTFASAGTYTIALTATDQGGLSATATATVTVSATLSAITVSPGAGSIKLGQSLAFSAAGFDQFGRSMGLSVVSWSASLGTIGPDGVYRATTAGDDRVTASVGSISGTARVQVRANASPRLLAPGASANPASVTGSTTTLAAIASDPDDDATSLIYTWSVIASPAGAPMPTFSTNGGNTSSSSVATFGQAGGYTFSVTVADPEGASVVGTVQVMVSAAVVSLSISPGSILLAVGQSGAFSAMAIDQFGQAFASPAVDWSASTGSINAAGLLTAGASSAGSSVSARIGSLVATAVVQPNYGLTQPAILDQFSTRFADGRIDRNDMIAVLDSAGDGGTVGQRALNDLNAILNASASYHIPDYVKSLATSVVVGSPANAHYQGAALGNLTAGSPASQLTNLVNKWFLGADHPQTDTPYLNYSPTYARALGALYQTGPSAGDMKQGQVGDCYLIATLGAIARTNPAAIGNMIVDNGDDTWTVRFYARGTAQYVTVDRYLPVDRQGRLIFAGMGAYANSGSTELWMPLIEKAYAQWYETGVSAPNNSGRNAYASIDTGYLTAVEGHLIGAASSQWSWYGGGFSTNLSQIIARLNQSGVAMTAGTAANPGGGLVGGHAYVITNYDASTGLFLLVNPWGASYPTVSLTAAQMDRWVVQVVAQDTTSSVAF